LLSEALADGFAAGESMPDIAKRIQAVFDGCSSRRSILIARTETISASAQGAIEGYKEAEIEQAEFLAAIDDRICEDCDAMNGEVFNLDDTGGIIPIHPDCRCCWIPVV
jgi:SPP1 gp7 family putative phage head morphogenesis protein